MSESIFRRQHEHEETAQGARPEWKPYQDMNRDTTNLVSGGGYGFFTWADLFTDRQLVALTTYSDLVKELQERIRQDAIDAGMPDDDKPGAARWHRATGVC